MAAYIQQWGTCLWWPLGRGRGSPVLSLAEHEASIRSRPFLYAEDVGMEHWHA